MEAYYIAVLWLISGGVAIFFKKIYMTPMWITLFGFAPGLVVFVFGFAADLFHIRPEDCFATGTILWLFGAFVGPFVSAYGRRSGKPKK